MERGRKGRRKKGWMKEKKKEKRGIKGRISKETRQEQGRKLG